MHDAHPRLLDNTLFIHLNTTNTKINSMIPLFCNHFTKDLIIYIYKRGNEIDPLVACHYFFNELSILNVKPSSQELNHCPNLIFSCCTSRKMNQINLKHHEDGSGRKKGESCFDFDHTSRTRREACCPGHFSCGKDITITAVGAPDIFRCFSRVWYCWCASIVRHE